MADEVLVILFGIMLTLTLFYVLLMSVSFFLFENIPSKEKGTAFECGFSTFSDSSGPFNVQYYFTALYFLVFDLELSLFIPYMPLILHLGYFSLFFFLFFIYILFICIFFERLSFSETTQIKLKGV